MKDPAFLFYPNDYLGGTLGMTFEEKGAYFELLMVQFNRGHMTEHMIGQILGQSMVKIWPNICSKFEVDANGLYFNERLEIEKNKRKAYSESRRNNKTGKNQYTKKNKKNGHMTEHMENRDENENVIINKEEKKELDFSNIKKETWKRWTDFKNSQFKFKYKSIESEQIALNELIKFSNDINAKAELIVNQSIAKGWKGLFELKIEAPQKEKVNQYPNLPKL